MAGKVIVSPGILLAVLLLVVFGYALVYVIANHKWGYTPKREKELEDADKSGES